jgi:uncharacterized DUF497 family protein
LTYLASTVEFEWDEAKDSANRERHGLAFSEAAELFQAGNAYLEIFDADPSEDEDRFTPSGRLPVASSWRSTQSPGKA